MQDSSSRHARRADLYLERGNVSLAANDFKVARQDYQQALALAGAEQKKRLVDEIKTQVKAYCDRLEGNNEWEQANVAWRSLNKSLLPGDGQALAWWASFWERWGDARHESGDTTGARQAYSRAADLDPRQRRRLYAKWIWKWILTFL